MFLKLLGIRLKLLVTLTLFISTANHAKTMQTESYSAKVLSTIVKAEMLLKHNSNEEALSELVNTAKSEANNGFERASLFYLMGIAYYNLKNFSEANKCFIEVFNNQNNPASMYLQAIKGFRIEYLNENQKNLILLRLKEINKIHSDINLKILEGELLHKFSRFDVSIKLLDSILANKTNLSESQLEKINELILNACMNSSKLDRALQISKSTLVKKPNKVNFRRLAYIYALLNEEDKHLNIWETINDTFDLDPKEARYFHEILKKRQFFSKANEILSSGQTKDFEE